MQLPGPTLIVTEGAIVTVTLMNNLPVAAGSTSIVFPGFTASATSTAPGSITSSGGTQGLLAMEAAHGTTVTYTLNTTGKAGTHAYYSGTQSDLQVEMGMYGALVVLPTYPTSGGTPNGQHRQRRPACSALAADAAEEGR